MDSTRRLRGVAMGAGYFSKFQYEAWTRIPEVEITAIYNRTESKARRMMAAYGIPRYYADWREMIDREQPDFVDIITNPETHEEMCAHAARRGVHIICQKPLAPTFEESRRIVETARAAGVRFMVHENWRWQPWYRKIKEIQQAGDIGEFTHLYFRMRMGDGWSPDAYLERQPFFRDYPRLLIYETGVHFIDTFRYLLGEVTEVYANLRRLNPVIKGEETGQVFFRFARGATAILDANRYNEVESPSPRYTFGEMRIDAMGGHLTMDTESNLRLKPLGQPGAEVDYERANVNFAGDCVYFLQRHFVNCMLSGGEFEAHGEDYLKTLRVVDAVYESAAAGQVVKLAAQQVGKGGVEC
ncbi:MAG: Gfo/Idh/MocA family oxidoreductase [Acidobacteria bacterium]|nr:Gfo/Idh/MocA family oxidoreductase [Acidobacteriota bacterium]